MLLNEKLRILREGRAAQKIAIGQGLLSEFRSDYPTLEAQQRKVAQEVIRASDTNRILAGETTLANLTLDRYFLFNRSYFEDVAAGAQLHLIDRPGSRDDKSLISHMGDIYLNLGNVRQIDIVTKPIGYEGISYRSLSVLAPRLLGKIHAFLSQDLSGLPWQMQEAKILPFLTKAYMALLFLHLPADGCGRTNEDFLIAIQHVIQQKVPEWKIHYLSPNGMRSGPTIARLAMLQNVMFETVMNRIRDKHGTDDVDAYEYQLSLYPMIYRLVDDIDGNPPAPHHIFFAIFRQIQEQIELATQSYEANYDLRRMFPD